MRSPDCVNVDSNARKQAEAQLDNPTPQTFEVAQTQVKKKEKKEDSFEFKFFSSLPSVSDFQFKL